MAWTIAEIVDAGSASKKIGRMRAYKRLFRVYAAAAGDAPKGKLGARALLNSAGLVVGAYYFDSIDSLTDQSAVCVDVTITPEAGSARGTAYVAELTYESRGTPPRPDEPLDSLQDDPVNRPYSVRGATAHREQTLQRGNFLGSFRLNDGTQVGAAMAKRPLASSAGEPIATVPNYDGSAMEWVIQKNLSTTAWSSAVAGLWANAINSATWNNFAAYTVRIVHIDFERVWEPSAENVAGTQYYSVTYHFEHKPDFWYFEFDDLGSFEIRQNQRSATRLKDGLPVVQYLDGTGKVLTDADVTAGKFVKLRYLPLDWPLKAFASIPGGPFSV